MSASVWCIPHEYISARPEQFVQLPANKDLISLSGRETQSIGGETAVLERGKDDKPAKHRMAVDDRILVEISGSGKGHDHRPGRHRT